MADNRRKTPNAGELFKMLNMLPAPMRIMAVIVLVVGGLVWMVVQSSTKTTEPQTAPGVEGDALLAVWNVANLFDDVDDPASFDTDEDFYAANPAAFEKKVDQIAQAVLMMNDGRGPDILTMVEVESALCMTKLQQRLNSRLDQAGLGKWAYSEVVFYPDNTGRRFAPGTISRVQTIKAQSRKAGTRGDGRMLITTLEQDGHLLTLLTTHWTSRVSDRDGHRRMSYAETTYGEFRKILESDPSADVIVCGDFNDEFKDPSMQQGLRASDDLQAVIDAAPPQREPMLFDVTTLLRDPSDCTICYGAKKQIFDHLCISRGLLDNRGWTCDPKSASIFKGEGMTKKNGCPIGYDKKEGTGFSDHLPVTVRLRCVK